MDDSRKPSLPPHRAESRLVQAATDAVKNSYANPDRIDCPDSEAIEAIAARRLSDASFDDIVDHIAMCAACLEEYNHRRREYRVRRRWIVAFAALLLFGLVTTYFSIREKHPNNQFAEKTETAIQATLDYSGWTAERSLSPLSAKREAPRAPRARLALAVLLPIGTEDGPYTVQIRTVSGEIVAQTNGIAKWTGKVEKLDVSLDMSRIPAGTYTLAVQSADASQRSYPLLLE